MTLAAALTPLMVATVLAIAITTLHRHLPPIVAARTVLVTLILVLLATLPALWLVSLGFVAGSSLLGGSFQWCAEALGTRQHVPPWLGVTATIVAVAGSAGPNTASCAPHRLVDSDRCYGRARPVPGPPPVGAHLDALSGVTRPYGYTL